MPNLRNQHRQQIQDMLQMLHRQNRQLHKPMLKLRKTHRPKIQPMLQMRSPIRDRPTKSRHKEVKEMENQKTEPRDEEKDKNKRLLSITTGSIERK